MKHKTLLPLYLKGLVSGKYTLRQAAESTGYNKDYLCVLKKRYMLEGFSCLDNKNKYRAPKNKTPETLKRKIVKLYSKKYQDINFKYYTKCLKDFEGIKISYSTVRLIMSEYGFRSPEAHKIKKIKEVHRPRLRRQNEGDLLQIDGTPYPWFYKFGNDTYYSCHGGIDDATGKLTGLYMTKNECLYGYLEMLRQTFSEYGMPREIYSDRAAIFCVTPKEKKNLTIWEQLAGIHDKKTQWQRILEELHIRQILAWSPQAKGRVERMWHTVQGRLPMWLKLHHADTVEKANRLLPQFVREFNDEFAVTPGSENTFWIPPEDNFNDTLQCIIPRTTNCSGEFSFHSYKFTIDAKVNIAHKKFDLCISERGIFARINGKYWPVQIIDRYIAEGDMTQVLEDIIYRYMYAYQKELSA